MTNDLRFDKERLLEMYKLKNIKRYNHRTRLKEESVAEHSFFTTLIALELCKKFKLNDKDTLLCLVKSLLHDMPEIEFNDITYDVKLKLNLYPLLKIHEDKYFEEHFADYASILTNDDENLINLIVKYADAMSVLQYSYNELDLGNNTFEQIKLDTLNRLELLEKKLNAFKGDK